MMRCSAPCTFVRVCLLFMLAACDASLESCEVISLTGYFGGMYKLTSSVPCPRNCESSFTCFLNLESCVESIPEKPLTKNTAHYVSLFFLKNQMLVAYLGVTGLVHLVKVIVAQVVLSERHLEFGRGEDWDWIAFLVVYWNARAGSENQDFKLVALLSKHAAQHGRGGVVQLHYHCLFPRVLDFLL